MRYINLHLLTYLLYKLLSFTNTRTHVVYFPASDVPPTTTATTTTTLPGSSVIKTTTYTGTSSLSTTATPQSKAF